MEFLFQREVGSEASRDLPRVVGLIAAGLAFCGISVWEIQAILRSGVSTAAIGLIVVPIIGGIAAIPGFAAGWCFGFFLCNWRSQAPRRRVQALALVLIPVALIAWLSCAVSRGINLSRQVHHIETMNARELGSLLDGLPQPMNKFVLAAIAQNPHVTTPILHRIVTMGRAELYKPMGSHFDVNGKNTKGLAVMRLIASHPNVSTSDLEIVAATADEYVLGAVAANPKLSIATMRKLATRHSYLIESGLARNPQAPPEVLLKSASNADDSLRASVAANPNTPAEALQRLSADPSSFVRLNVARNLSTPRNIIDHLSFDPVPQVSQAARDRLKNAVHP